MSAVLLLFAPSVPIYLGLLGKLAHAIGDDRVRGLLDSSQSDDALVAEAGN